MEIDKEDIIKKIRIAIDEILPEDSTETDTFWEDQDTEIWQAVRIAAEQLSMELPRDLLEPVSVENAAVTTGVDGESKYLMVEASKYLTLYELKMEDWKMSVITTFASGGADEMMQQNKWTRGTIYKPKVMEIIYGEYVRLYYWSSDKNTVSRFSYIPRPYINDKGDLVTGLQDSAESYIIYRAARLVLTAKKETALAEEMEAISKSLGGSTAVAEA